jgi:hypothetical protein
MSEKYKEALDKLADLAHEIWAGWYKYQRDNGNADNIERWNRQSETDYKDLSEEDKEKDRKIARQYLECFANNFHPMLYALADRNALEENKEDK